MAALHGRRGPRAAGALSVSHRWRRAWRFLWHRDAVTQEMDDEIAAHLAFATDELVLQGVPLEEARRRAQLEFGSVPAVRAEAAAQRPLAWMFDLARDLRWSARQARRAPIASLALTLTAALGVGGLSLVFSVVNAAWLRPLPYPAAGALESVLAITPERTLQRDVSPAVAAATRDAVQEVGRVAEYTVATARVVMPGVSALLTVTYVDSALFSVLRIGERAGRLPTPQEYATGAAVALVRDSIWRRLPDAERRAGLALINIDGRPHRVIGAFPDAMHFPERSEIWLPMQRDVTLRSLVVRRDASATPDAFAAALASAHDDPRLDGWRLLPASVVDRGESRPVAIAFAMLFGLALLLAMATAANVALQNSAMALRRRAELATWAALGATSSRLVRRLLADQVLIVGVAGVLGTFIAQLTLRYVRQALGDDPWPGWISLALDWRVVLASVVFTAAMIALTAILPAREGSRVDPVRAMREGGMAGITALGARRSTTRLIAVQMAMSLALSCTAASLVVAYRAATTASRHPGDAQRLEASVYASSTRPRTAAADAAVLDSLAQAVRARQLGRAARFHDAYSRRLDVPSRARIRAVDADYFEVDGRRFVAGSNLDGPPIERGAAAAIVNEGFARARGVSPAALIGQPIQARDSLTSYRIVGVVADRGRDSEVARPLRAQEAVEVFVPRVTASGREQLLVLADGDVPTLRVALRDVAADLAPDGDLGRLATLEETQRLQLMPIALSFRVIGAAAAIVLLISMVGLHGLVSQMAASRRVEAGIRIALGATPRRVAVQIVAQSLRGVAIGTLLGQVIAIGVAWWLMTWLRLPTLAMVAGLAGTTIAVLAAVAAACAAPASRLMRDDPAALLRAP